MGRPVISVIIPTVNGRALLPLALDSLRRQTLPPDEVIVVDNGSVDGTVTWLQEEYPEVRVLALGHNTGFSFAVNRGVEATSGDYVALLNNDVEVGADWISALTSRLQADRAAGSAASKMLVFHHRSILDGAGDVMAWSGIPLPRGHRQRDAGQLDAPSYVFGARAGAAMYRRVALEDVGSFDEDFFAFCEDVDWAFRAQLRGWRCAYEPAGIAYHVGGASSTSEHRMVPRFYAMNRRNIIWMVVKDFPRQALIRHAGLLAAGQFLLLATAVRDRALRAQLLAWWQAMLGLPRMLAKRRVVQRSACVERSALDEVIVRRIRPPV